MTPPARTCPLYRDSLFPSEPLKSPVRPAEQGGWPHFTGGETEFQTGLVFVFFCISSWYKKVQLLIMCDACVCVWSTE